MTFDQLEHTLPNGLPDAELLGVSIDYLQQQVTLTLDVFVGDFSGPLEKREAYRKALVTISGLRFFAIDPPAPNYPYADSKPFFVSLWVSNWNAFAHLAGTDAELVWQDAGITYREKREHYPPGEIIEAQ